MLVMEGDSNDGKCVEVSRTAERRILRKLLDKDGVNIARGPAHTVRWSERGKSLLVAVRHPKPCPSVWVLSVQGLWRDLAEFSQGFIEVEDELTRCSW